MNPASEGELSALHAVVARYLADKISSGECTASDVSNAIKMLKDNNITCAPTEGKDLDNLKNALDKRTAKVDGVDLVAAMESLEFTQGRH